MSQENAVKKNTMNYNKNRPKAENPVKIEDLSLRDGHQSLFATRGRTEDMLPIAEMMDQVGFWAMEVWGGATFDTMHRFLNEDPWERIRTLKKYIKKTPFSMLLRGQNLVGYRNYADDVAKAFVERAAANGMDVFRTFDALNDYRNFETVVQAIKETGKHFQGCICYTLTEPRLGGEVYNLDYYVKKAKELEAMGADTICIKDMAGLIAPYDAYELIVALKKAVKAPIHLHSHFTSGMSALSMLKAIEAGVDIIDTCMTPYAYRTAHPAIEPMVMTLLGTNRDTGFDIKLLASINEVLEKEVMPKYKHLLDDTKMSIIDINVLLHQTPGGMISNLVNQLKRDGRPRPHRRGVQGAAAGSQGPRPDPAGHPDQPDRGRADGQQRPVRHPGRALQDDHRPGQGPLLRPVRQDRRPHQRRGAEEGAQRVCPRGEAHHRPAGRGARAEMEKAKEATKGLAKDIDDVLVYALYPVTGMKFLKWKYGKEAPPAETKPITMEEVRRKDELVQKAKAGLLVEKPQKKAPPMTESARKFNVFVDGEYFEVGVESLGGAPVVNTVRPMAAPLPAAVPAPAAPAPVAAPAPEAPAPAAAPKAAAGDVKGAPLTAPMPGMIVKYVKNVGDKVKEGETVVVLEAMKMENALPAPANGTVKAVNFSSGDSVKKGDVLAIVG